MIDPEIPSRPARDGETRERVIWRGNVATVLHRGSDLVTILVDGYECSNMVPVGEVNPLAPERDGETLSDDTIIKRWRADAIDFKHEYWDRIVALCDTVAALRADLNKTSVPHEPPKPLSDTEREQVTVWMARNPGTAASCLLPRVWTCLVVAEATVAALRAEVARQDALLRDVGSIALASWAPESGMYNIRIPDATWQAVRAHIRAECAASGEDRSNG